MSNAVTAAEICNNEYLNQLLEDRKQLSAFPKLFMHLERLLDEGNTKFVLQIA